MIRLAAPSIEDDDLAAVREVLVSGHLVQGPRVKRFEDGLAAITGARHNVAVSNGTAALHLALLALGVEAGDLVAVTAYSWISTANVIEFRGARPVFVDIDPRTFNMDPAALESALAAHVATGRLKAVLPIDAFGQMADLAAIGKIAGRYGLPVVEDAACALGASLHGRCAGSWTKLATFSFHPRKAVTTGEGGLIATDDDKLAWKLRVLRNHGQDPDAATPEFVLPGYNCRMTEFQAALGSTQIAKLGRIAAKRRELAANYDRLFAGSAVSTPFVPKGNSPVFQSYVCLLPAFAAARRAEIIQKLREQGVETTIGTWHMPLAHYYRERYGYRRGDFPVTDEVFARTLSLPMFEALTPHEQGIIAGLVRQAAQ